MYQKNQTKVSVAFGAVVGVLGLMMIGCGKSDSRSSDMNAVLQEGAQRNLESIPKLETVDFNFMPTSKRDMLVQDIKLRKLAACSFTGNFTPAICEGLDKTFKDNNSNVEGLYSGAITSRNNDSAEEIAGALFNTDQWYGFKVNYEETIVEIVNTNTSEYCSNSKNFLNELECKKTTQVDQIVIYFQLYIKSEYLTAAGRRYYYGTSNNADFSKPAHVTIGVRGTLDSLRQALASTPDELASIQSDDLFPCRIIGGQNNTLVGQLGKQMNDKVSCYKKKYWDKLQFER